MKQIINILPVIIFFIFYKFYDIFVASESLIVTSGIICIVHCFFYKKIEKITLFSFIIVLIFSSLTIFLHNTQFIKWKITIVYALFSIFLLTNQFFKKKLIVQIFLEKDIKISNFYWKKINLFWSLFFLFCSFLNLYIAFSFSEEIWVNFKVFGLFFLTLISILITSIYINYIVLKKK